MDRQDQKLLDRQLRNLHLPPRRDGIAIIAILVVFLGGMIIGGLLSKPSAAMRTAANQISVLNGAPATTQQ